MNEYKYNCVDKSILLPYFKKYYVSVFHKIVPRGLTANFITLISSGFIFLTLFASTLLQSGNTVPFALLLAFCLHNYVVGDHLDGMQAKVSHTSSPLGEYLDHYLDVYNGAIVVYVLTIFFAPLPKPVFYWFLILNALSFAITMVEELERQELYFGILGTLEGIVLLVLFFMSWAVDPIRQFWNYELYNGYSRYWIVIIFFGIGYIGTLIDVIRRIRYIPRQFIIFALTTILLAYSLFYLDFSNFTSWLILTLVSGEYISKVMESYLIGKKHKYPDLLLFFSAIVVALATAFELLSFPFLISLVNVLAVYIGIKVVILFFAVIYQLRQFWYWINPSL